MQELRTMEIARYLVSTRKKQRTVLLFCLIITITGYLYRLSGQWSSHANSNYSNVPPFTYDVFKPLSGNSSARNINKYIRNVTRIETKNIVKENVFQPNIRNSILHKEKKSHKSIDNTLFYKVSYNVHIFYYPWYGNPHIDGKYIHWNHQYLPHWNKDIAAQYKKGAHVPPDDIGSDFYPELGCYSSSDDGTIREHMRQIRMSGSGVVVVSWYPARMADQQGIPVDKLIPKLLDIAAEFQLKVTLHIEPYKERNGQTVRDDAVYIHKKYAKHSAFYKYKTKDNRYLPLLYVYDSYHTTPQEWADLLKPDGKYTIRNTPFDCVMIALMVEFTHRDYIDIGGFDGFYTYFAVNGFTYGSRWNAWSNLKSFAAQTNTIFIPSVGPGYIDTSIRPWNYANTRSRENGEYYRKSFQAALSVQPPLISVTSFNEWHEGTQIERAVPKSGYKDYSPNGPDYYLKLTRTYVERFEKWNEK